MMPELPPILHGSAEERTEQLRDYLIRLLQSLLEEDAVPRGEKGERGERGPRGERGEQGPPGRDASDLETLRALAFKDSASGSYTPAGTVSKPTVTVTPATGTVNSITDVGTLPVMTTTVSGENLIFGFSRGTLPAKGGDTTVVTGVSAEACRRA